MKAQVRVTGGIFIEVEGSEEKALFKDIARVKEVFDHPCCGKCKSTDVTYVCRKDSDENDWYEMACQNLSCRAKLPFGVTKKGGLLFAKTRIEKLSKTQQKERPEDCKAAEANNGWLPDGGWFVYKKKN